MAIPKIGDRWEIFLPTDRAKDFLELPKFEAVVIRRVRIAERMIEQEVGGWIVRSAAHPELSGVVFPRHMFFRRLISAPKRKKMSESVKKVLKDLVVRGDGNFALDHQIARSLIKDGLAKWITTTDRNFASLHATIEGFRLFDELSS